MYVFGVDIPLPEILALAFFIMVIGMIIVFFEVVRLRNLEQRELLNLKKLDDDIKELDTILHKNIYITLQNYVYVELYKGRTKDEIKKKLLREGYTGESIDNVMNNLPSKKKTVTSPQKHIEKTVEQAKDMTHREPPYGDERVEKFENRPTNYPDTAEREIKKVQ